MIKDWQVKKIIEMKKQGKKSFSLAKRSIKVRR